MTIQRIPIDQENDRAGWLALREPDVTASVVAALFGASPYMTKADLYWSKKGQAPARTFSEAMGEWREDLEAVFPIRVRRKRPEWRLEKARAYLRDPAARIGATPDFYVYGDPRGLGVLQAKTSDRRTFEREWRDGSVPFWILLQNSVELMLEPEAAFGAVAVITIEAYRSETEIFDIPRIPALERKIRDAVAKFWTDVEFENEPPLDPQRDGQVMAMLYPEEVTNKSVDLSGDNALPVLLAERQALKATIREADSRCEEIDNEIKAKMLDAEAARIGADFSATFRATTRQPQPAKPGGIGPRVLRITDHRKPEEDHAKRPY